MRARSKIAWVKTSRLLRIPARSDQAQAPAPPVTPAPTLASTSFSLVDPGGGGQSIVLTGTDLSDVTTVTYDTTPVAPSATTATTVTFTPPAHAGTGAIGVTVTSPGGTSNALTLTIWSPAQIANVAAFYDAEKGITQSGGLVSQWSDQSGNGLDATQPTGAVQPLWDANAFGSLHGMTTTGSQHLDIAARTGAANMSFFWVAKYTATTSTSTDYAGDAPISVIGDNTGSVENSAGYNGGQLAFTSFIPGWTETDRGSGLNDGTPRLAGWTIDSSGNLSAYVGATQQGAAAPGQTPSGGLGWNTLLASYNPGVNGMQGTVAAVVVVDAVISGGDHADLNAWAQQRWGTP